MSTGMIVMIVILVIMIALAVGLYFLGKRAEKKQAEQQEMMEQYKQTVSMLIIDKKKLKVKDAGLPAGVAEQVPWYGRWQKLPVAKVKVGPQIMNMIVDDKIYDDLPLKKEIKATISGLYILGVKGLHGKKAVDETPKKKSRLRRAYEAALEKAGAKPVK